jgi:hypothetical protein
VFPSRNQPLQHQHLVVVEHIPIQATHYLEREDSVHNRTSGGNGPCPMALKLLPVLGQSCWTPVFPHFPIKCRKLPGNPALPWLTVISVPP